MNKKETAPGAATSTLVPVDVAQLRQLHVAARILTECLRRALRPLGLRIEWWLVLEALGEKPRSAAEISTKVAAPKGSVSRWLSSLRQRDLVQCPHAVEDQRRMCVSLTAVGLAQRQLARDCIESVLHEQDVRVGESLENLCKMPVPVQSRRER